MKTMKTAIDIFKAAVSNQLQPLVTTGLAGYNYVKKEISLLFFYVNFDAVPLSISLSLALSFKINIIYSFPFLLLHPFRLFRSVSPSPYLSQCFSAFELRTH